jgi:hypothetical protein
MALFFILHKLFIQMHNWRYLKFMEIWNSKEMFHRKFLPFLISGKYALYTLYLQKSQDHICRQTLFFIFTITLHVCILPVHYHTCFIFSKEERVLCFYVLSAAVLPSRGRKLWLLVRHRRTKGLQSIECQINFLNRNIQE